MSDEDVFIQSADAIVYLFNNLFDMFNLIKMESINLLADEHQLKSLICEIEPNFEETIGRPIEITSNNTSLELCDSNDFSNKYTNFISIINALETYFTVKTLSEGMKLSHEFAIKENIKVNEIVKASKNNLNNLNNSFVADGKNKVISLSNENRQNENNSNNNDNSEKENSNTESQNKSLTNLGEIIILLAAVSSDKDKYIDRVGEISHIHLTEFLTIVEKYLLLNEKTTQFSKRTSLILNYSDSTKTFLAVDKISKKMEKFESEKNKLLKTIDEIQSEKESLKERNTNTKLVFETKIIDLEREIEMLKNSNDELLKVHNQTYKEVLKLDSLKKTIADQAIEIETLNTEHKNQVKSYLEKISVLQDSIMTLEETKEEFNSLTCEHEKLKIKNKEMSLIKEQLQTSEDKIEKMESYVKTLLIEKEVMQEEINKLNSDVINEKDQVRKLQHKNEELEFKMEEQNNLMKNIRTAVARKSLLSIETILSEENEEKKDEKEFEDNNLGYQLPLGAFSDRNVNNLDLEINEQNENLIKEENMVRNSENKTGFTNHVSENEEKHEIVKSCENEVTNHISDNWENEEKHEIVKNRENEVTNHISENCENKLIIETNSNKESHKESEINSTETKDNFVLNSENENLSHANTPTETKNNILGENNKPYSTINEFTENIKESINLVINTDTNPQQESRIEEANQKNSKTQNEDMALLFRDFKEMKENIISPLHNQIDNQNERIKFLEGENKKLMNLLQANLEKYNEETKQRSEDFDFLKKAYQDQKAKYQREHETLSAAFMDITMKFVVMKDSLKKKANDITSENEKLKTNK